MTRPGDSMDFHLFGSLPDQPDAKITESDTPFALSLLERRHSKKWTDVSPMEFLQYSASLLHYPSACPNEPSDQPSDSPKSQACFTAVLSRDRRAQIKRTLFFPDITSLMETLNSYSLPSRTAESVFPLSEEIDAKHVLSTYLQGLVAHESPQQVLASLRSMGVSLNEKQGAEWTAIRETERQEDMVLWYVTQLLLNAGYELYCQQKKVAKSALSPADYGCLVVSSVQWLNHVPVSYIFDGNVHILVEGRRAKSGVLRRHCSVCSPRGSKSSKRTRYMCLQCNKPFCFHSSCFELYHQQNGLKYYKFETFHPLSSVCWNRSAVVCVLALMGGFSCSF